MTKVQIEIVIPDGQEIVEIEQQGGTSCLVFFSAIIRPVWQWPSWLLCDWVARNPGGMIVLGIGPHDVVGCTHCNPRCDDAYWVVHESFLGINLPPCTDWRQSLRLNPNREVKS